VKPQQFFSQPYINSLLLKMSFSSAAELDNLNVNWNENAFSWEAFGNLIQSDVERFKDLWFPISEQLSVVNRGKLQDIWTRHPNRQQQGNLLCKSLLFLDFESIYFFPRHLCSS
jgi:hypothetical protein